MTIKKLQQILKIVFLIFILSSCVSSCTSDKKVDIKPCEGNIPDTVSFKKNIIPLFHANCSLSGCHAGAYAQRNLNLEDSVAYSQLTRANKGYINMASPELSLLYIQMTSKSNPMPPKGLLQECDINLVLKWIKQGAINN